MPAYRLEPTSAEDLAAALAGAYADGKIIEITGNASKRRLGGPLCDAGVELTTKRLSGVLAYEPADLTISVQAGLRWAELTRLLAENNQMIPLDPPFGDQATVGGALAADSSGPRRRRYGTARDMVIGMQFATVEGKLVQSGGMVVKNVTGLDMAKLMLGSFGTLACITTVNFKLFPRPAREATFVFRAAAPEKLLALRNAILSGVAQPVALDLLNGSAAQALGLELDTAFALLAKAEGSPAVIARYRAEYEGLAGQAGVDVAVPEDSGADALWGAVREFQSTALTGYPGGVLLRIATVSTRLREAIEEGAPHGWLVARAANAVVHLFCPSVEGARHSLERLRRSGFHVVVESMPAGANLDQWPGVRPDLPAMRKLKATFDPGTRLSPGRLWGLL